MRVKVSFSRYEVAWVTTNAHSRERNVHTIYFLPCLSQDWVQVQVHVLVLGLGFKYRFPCSCTCTYLEFKNSKLLVLALVLRPKLLEIYQVHLSTNKYIAFLQLCDKSSGVKIKVEFPFTFLYRIPFFKCNH